MNEPMADDKATLAPCMIPAKLFHAEGATQVSLTRIGDDRTQFTAVVPLQDGDPAVLELNRPTDGARVRVPCAIAAVHHEGGLWGAKPAVHITFEVTLDQATKLDPADLDTIPELPERRAPAPRGRRRAGLGPVGLAPRKRVQRTEPERSGDPAVTPEAEATAPEPVAETELEPVPESMTEPATEPSTEPESATEAESESATEPEPEPEVATPEATPPEATPPEAMEAPPRPGDAAPEAAPLAPMAAPPRPGEPPAEAAPPEATSPPPVAAPPRPKATPRESAAPLSPLGEPSKASTAEEGSVAPLGSPLPGVEEESTAAAKTPAPPLGGDAPPGAAGQASAGRFDGLSGETDPEAEAKDGVYRLEDLLSPARVGEITESQRSPRGTGKPEGKAPWEPSRKEQRTHSAKTPEKQGFFSGLRKAFERPGRRETSSAVLTGKKPRITSEQVKREARIISEVEVMYQSAGEQRRGIAQDFSRQGMFLAIGPSEPLPRMGAIVRVHFPVEFPSEVVTCRINAEIRWVHGEDNDLEEGRGVGLQITSFDTRAEREVFEAYIVALLEQ